MEEFEEGDIAEEGSTLTRGWLLPRSQSLFLGILALFACVVAFGALRSVLMPLAFAWILTAMLAPLVRAMVSCRIPHAMAVAISLVFLLIVFFEAGMLVNELVSSFVAKYGTYSARITTLLKFFYAINVSEDLVRQGTFDIKSGKICHKNNYDLKNEKE